MPTCFLVLGVPRTGTSCVAGVLHYLGISMGSNLRPAQPMNAAGFFTDLDFENLHLADSFKDYCSLRSQCGDWGLKSPTVIDRFIDFERDCDCVIKLLVTSRPQPESLASWKKRTSLSEPVLVSLLDSYAKQIGAIQAKGFDALTIEFDRLLNDSQAAIALIAEFCGRESNASAIAFVNPALRTEYSA
jgi:hypothetical protein